MEQTFFHTLKEIVMNPSQEYLIGENMVTQSLLARCNQKAKTRPTLCLAETRVDIQVSRIGLALRYPWLGEASRPALVKQNVASEMPMDISVI